MWEILKFLKTNSKKGNFNMTGNNDNSAKRILIIEDDKELSELVGLHLNDLNYNTIHCNDGSEGLAIALEEQFDLIVLDLMLPGIDGLEICRRIRNEQIYTPILMLTSKSEETDRVLGLELGADDYLTKPFSIRELIARVKAIFRRVESITNQSKNQSNNGEEPELKQIGDLSIDLKKRIISLAGKPIELTVKEFDLLELFSSNPGRAYSRETLLTMVWGYQYGGYEHTVNSHINRLRSKIESDPANPKYIKTVWGYGYRFADLEELEK